MADAADMRAFGASEAACIYWPDDTELHRACREAYCRGAADCVPKGDVDLVAAFISRDLLIAAADTIDKLKQRIAELAK